MISENDSRTSEQWVNNWKWASIQWKEFPQSEVCQDGMGASGNVGASLPGFGDVVERVPAISVMEDPTRQDKWTGGWTGAVVPRSLDQ